MARKLAAWVRDSLVYIALAAGMILAAWWLYYLAGK